MPKSCFLLSLIYVVEKDTFRKASGVGASVAPMKGSRDDQTANEWLIGLLLAVSGGLRIYRNAGINSANK